MREKGAIGDQRVAQLATRQHGIVSTSDLLNAGFSDSGIGRRVAAGSLHRLHRGVYAVGHTSITAEGHWLAAVIACGKGAVLSHRSAAALWGLIPVPSGSIDVTVPTSGGRRRRERIRIHRSRCLIASDVTQHRRIPVTTPARTLSDLRRVFSPAGLQQAIRAAESLRLDAGDQGHEPDGTRSELERRFLALCRRHRLARPLVNQTVGPYEVDFLWPGPGVIVEVDGFRHHGSRSAFESDRARDVELRLMGYEVLRYTYRQVKNGQKTIAASLRALLA
jgi:very-short-patch-repair endonuclease